MEPENVQGVRTERFTVDAVTIRLGRTTQRPGESVKTIEDILSDGR